MNRLKKYLLLGICLLHSSALAGTLTATDTPEQFKVDLLDDNFIRIYSCVNAVCEKPIFEGELKLLWHFYDTKKDAYGIAHDITLSALFSTVSPLVLIELGAFGQHLKSSRAVIGPASGANQLIKKITKKDIINSIEGLLALHKDAKKNRAQKSNLRNMVEDMANIDTEGLLDEEFATILRLATSTREQKSSAAEIKKAQAYIKSLVDFRINQHIDAITYCQTEYYPDSNICKNLLSDNIRLKSISLGGVPAFSMPTTEANDGK